MALGCPRCDSQALTPFGGRSILDGKRKRRCEGCGAILGPPRNRAALGFFFVLAVAVTALCVPTAWDIATGQFNWNGVEEHKPSAILVFVGCLVGPAVIALTTMCLTREMPRRLP